MYEDMDEDMGKDEDGYLGWNYNDVMYGGAPDECDFHWPVKFVEGYCPVDGCPESKQNNSI